MDEFYVHWYPKPPPPSDTGAQFDTMFDRTPPKKKRRKAKKDRKYAYWWKR